LDILPTIDAHSSKKKIKGEIAVNVANVATTSVVEAWSAYALIRRKNEDMKNKNMNTEGQSLKMENTKHTLSFFINSESQIYTLNKCNSFHLISH